MREALVRSRDLKSDGVKGGDLAVDLFIESGSTLLYISYELNKILLMKNEDIEVKNLFSAQGKGIGRLSVKTNNNLTAWLYLHLHAESGQFPEEQARGPDKEPITPFLISGYLEGKYHGVFPFYPVSNRPIERRYAESMDRLTREEEVGYAQCRADLSRLNFLLLATSRLSLLHGPTVGSRQNAIFKNATYNSCVPNLGERPAHVIHLFITARKLLAHNKYNVKLLENDGQKEGEERRWTGDIKERFYSMDHELKRLRVERCFPAFNIPSNMDEQETVVRSPFHRSLCGMHNTQPLLDGTSAVNIGERRFRVCSTWDELFSKAGLSVEVFVSFKVVANECPLGRRNSPRNTCNGTADSGNEWVNLTQELSYEKMNDNKKEYCEQEEACSCQECWIIREVQFANSELNERGIEYQFCVLNDQSSSAAKRNGFPDSQVNYRLGRITIKPMHESKK
jgi:hypothetical protein